MSFGDGRSLSSGYDNRMRPASWNVSNVLGFSYTYRGSFSDGGNNQVSYARNLSSNGGRDSTLDRSYEYDQVGALVFARSGAEARATFGIDSQGWGQKDGPYSQGYDYDKFGNMTLRYGWGGEVQGGDANNEPSPIEYHYTNNKLNDFIYDAAGNEIYDGGSRQYKYDANGQQVDTPFSVMPLQQAYDGDSLRIRKTENLSTTYYLRSSVLGGRVVAELDGNGNWTRGYVYQGDELLATQSGGQVNWTHTDPVTKSQRVTDINGSVITNGVVELDPWGANTSRSSGGAPFQPQNFAGYTRDGDGQQDAMARRYSITGRFSQPDPSSASYDLTDPQSLNRYIYTKNDPVNFRDPNGLVALEDWGGDPTKRHFGGWEGALASGGGFSFIWFRIPGLERDQPNLLVGLYFGFGGPQDTGITADYYRKFISKFVACLDTVFKKDAEKAKFVASWGMPSLDTSRSPSQVAATAGNGQILPGDHGAVRAINAPNEGSLGTIYVANTHAPPNKPVEWLYESITHEWGNILAFKLGDRTENKYGDPKGVGKQKDFDTGANMERCVHGKVRN
jgi:RHS repeat-associated protein